MIKSITFAELRRLLQDLGFEESTFREKFFRFEDTRSDTVFVFPAYQPEDWVRQVDLIVVRRFLDERGLMDAAKFDHLLNKTPA